MAHIRMSKTADSSDEDLVSEIPVNADQMLFVEDLLDCMQLQYPPNYAIEWDPRPFRENIFNGFNSSVQNALRFYEDILKSCLYDIFCEIRTDNSVNSNTFERFAENLAEDFPKGFHPKYILFYCSILCRISIYFYNRGVLDATVLAKKCILKFLGKYNMLAHEWDSMQTTAEFYEKMLLSQNVPCLDSDKTEHKVQTQNEESGDEESNTSRSKKQNVSSKNKESNHKTQRKSVCSKQKPFLKKSPRKVLESNCGAGSIFSKGPGSLYSNIKADCKKRVILAWNRIKYANYKFCPGPSSGYQNSAQVGKIDCKRNLSMSLNAIDSKTSETFSTKGDKLTNKSASNDRSCRTGTSNTYRISSPLSINDCRRKLDFSPYVTNGTNCPLKRFGGNNLIKSDPNKNLISKTPNSDQLSVSSSKKLDSSKNENNASVDVSSTRDRLPILRDTVNNTHLERFSPS